MSGDDEGELEIDQLPKDLAAQLGLGVSDGEDEDQEDDEERGEDALTALTEVLKQSGYVRADSIPGEPPFPDENAIRSKGGMERALRAWEEFLFHLDGELIWYEAAEAILAEEHKALAGELKKTAANNGSLRNDMQRKAYVEGHEDYISSLRQLSEYRRYRKAQEKRRERGRNVSKMLQRLLYYGEDEAEARRTRRAGGGPGSTRTARERLKSKRRMDK